MAWSGARL